MSELSNAKLFIQILTKMWDADRREKIARHNDSVKRSVGRFVRNFSPEHDLQWSRRLNPDTLSWEGFLKSSGWRGDAKKFGI